MSRERHPVPETSTPDGASPAEAPSREQEAVQHTLEEFRVHCKKFELDIATKDPTDGPRLAAELHNYLQIRINKWNKRQETERTGRWAPSIPQHKVTTYLEGFYTDYGVIPPANDFIQPLRVGYLRTGLAAALIERERYTEIAAIMRLTVALRDAGYEVARKNANVLLAAIGMSFIDRGAD
ncbi:MAG TPA: hypothetical protein VGM08_01005 [Candidatus Saccharimonadales bacterium]